MDLNSFLKHLQRGVHGIPFLKQPQRPLPSDLQAHLVSSITAWGGGRDRHTTGTNAPWSSLQPFSLMGGKSGQLVVQNLSRMAVKFARVMCGSKEARVRGSISPSKFLNQNMGHIFQGADIVYIDENLNSLQISGKFKKAEQWHSA